MKAVLIPVLYLLGGVLTAPCALLAYFIWSVNGAIKQGNLFKFLLFMLMRMGQTMEWAVWIVAPLLNGWLVLAFLTKFRWIGASGMALVGVVALVEVYVVMAVAPTKEAPDYSFPAITVVGLLINLWIVWDAAPWAGAKF
jgi:hypothetical protein